MRCSTMGTGKGIFAVVRKSFGATRTSVLTLVLMQEQPDCGLRSNLLHHSWVKPYRTARLARPRLFLSLRTCRSTQGV